MMGQITKLLTLLGVVYISLFHNPYSPTLHVNCSVGTIQKEVDEALEPVPSPGSIQEEVGEAREPVPSPGSIQEEVGEAHEPVLSDAILSTTPTQAPTQQHEDWMCDPRVVRDLYQPKGKIYVVSFAGWQEKRKELMRKTEKRLMERSDRERLPITPLFFTEEDLPQSHLDEFAWAYAEDDYKGFWTWKPWLLWNLTSTGVFQPGDLVLWIDSDRTFRFTDDKALHNYVYTMFCNMEHRNLDNYGGIYPFERCFGHKEKHYTKPDVLAKMGAEHFADVEQIYAGSLGFRVNNETLQFLKEWKDYGHDPLFYGNDEDFPSQVHPPKGYGIHKNDQSVFSIMVRSHNMTTWATPYYWKGDSGVERCADLYQRSKYCFIYPEQGKRRKKDPLRKPCKPFEEWLQQQPLPEKVRRDESFLEVVESRLRG